MFPEVVTREFWLKAQFIDSNFDNRKPFVRER
jgi:hypothetical protein